MGMQKKENELKSTMNIANTSDSNYREYVAGVCVCTCSPAHAHPLRYDPRQRSECWASSKSQTSALQSEHFNSIIASKYKLHISANMHILTQ